MHSSTPVACAWAKSMWKLWIWRYRVRRWNGVGIWWCDPVGIWWLISSWKEGWFFKKMFNMVVVDADSPNGIWYCRMNLNDPWMVLVTWNPVSNDCPGSLTYIQASFWMAKWKGVVVQAKTDTVDTFVSLFELGMIMAAHCSPQDWST